jgi:AraC-like DNA-binding protein
VNYRDNWAPPGSKAARLHAIKKDILANLGEIALSLAAVAARHNISPRYVGRLFEQEGVTFSEFLLSARLECAHLMLTSLQFNGCTIASIAYSAGFGDLSYFNRAFRRRYSMTPSSVRAAARRQRRESDNSDSGMPA